MIPFALSAAMLQVKSDAKELMEELDLDKNGHLDLKEITHQYNEADPELPEQNDDDE